MPPPMSKISSPSCMPMGISTRPVFFTAPARANTLVPLLFAVPMEAYQEAPFRMIEGIAA